MRGREVSARRTLARLSGVEYEVRLDDRVVWPEPGSPFPPSVIRPMKNGEDLRLVFGSCRISAPHEPPYTLQFIEERRGAEGPPGEVVADFEEYARIYHDAWADPAIRWLLSTVPSAMIFDDHEVGDDWNISAAWVEEMRQKPNWNDQIIGGYAWSKPATLATRLLARLAGVRREPLAWRLTHNANFFESQVATLEFEGRHATITYEKAVLDSSNEPALKRLYQCRLA